MAEVPLLQALVILGAAVSAGVVWNTLGIWQKYKETGVKSLDWAKVRKNIIIGTILGLIGYAATLTDTVTIPEIQGLNSFILAIIAFLPFVVIAERIFTRKREAVVE